MGTQTWAKQLTAKSANKVMKKPARDDKSRRMLNYLQTATLLWFTATHLCSLYGQVKGWTIQRSQSEIAQVAAEFVCAYYAIRECARVNQCIS